MTPIIFTLRFGAFAVQPLTANFNLCGARQTLVAIFDRDRHAHRILLAR